VKYLADSEQRVVDDHQTPEMIAHLYDGDEETNAGSDEEQLLKWKQFLENRSEQEKKADEELLKAMELCEEFMGPADDTRGDQMVLGEETVANITAARVLDMSMGMKPCEKRRKSNKKPWGPTLVDRQRRKQNDGVSMLLKAMELK
jgi:hypothetical protein